MPAPSLGSAATRKEEYEQQLDKEQFRIGDTRDLDEVISGSSPENIFRSVPPATVWAYRRAFHGICHSRIHRQFLHSKRNYHPFEYLEDYSSEETKKVGYALIEKVAKLLEGR